MGYYIECQYDKGKANYLITNHNAILLSGAVEAFEAFSKGYGVVCVVDNGPFEAAAYIESIIEWEAFSRPNDYRPKQWLKMNRVVAEHLSGYANDCNTHIEED